MAARIPNITFDCDDVLKMAAFWSAVLPSAAHSTRGSNELFATIGGADESAGAGVVLQQGAPTEASQDRAYLDLVNPARQPSTGSGGTVPRSSANISYREKPIAGP